MRGALEPVASIGVCHPQIGTPSNLAARHPLLPDVHLASLARSQSTAIRQQHSIDGERSFLGVD